VVSATVQDMPDTRPTSWIGSDESWTAFAASCHESFRPPSKRTEWDEVGDVDGTFCRNCGSHFCPHAAPTLYSLPLSHGAS
jgi:hypothetical protein